MSLIRVQVFEASTATSLLSCGSIENIYEGDLCNDVCEIGSTCLRDLIVV